MIIINNHNLTNLIDVDAHIRLNAMTQTHQSHWQLNDMPTSMQLSGGTLSLPHSQTHYEEEHPGLKLVLLLEGQVSYQLGGNQQVSMQGPSCHLSHSETPFTVAHQYGETHRLNYVSIRLPHEDNQALFDDLVSPLLQQHQHSSKHPLILDNPASKAVLSIGRQMLLCPNESPLQRLFLYGKALELMANAFSSFKSHSHHDARISLNTADTKRFHEVKALLQERLSHPPKLSELAQFAGMNVSKLTFGFKQLFGLSVYDFIRQQRLEMAYHMLVTQQMSIGDVAHACGYTDSHFSKVFKQRFGCLPSQIR
ncbi:MAG: helix-turn-helix transcriptional regulator [Neisseriaceae bacterium]